MPALAFITIGIDPIAFRVGSIPIHWYGIMYAIAFMVASTFVALPYVQKRGVSKAVSENMLIWAIIAGLVGARLYFVVQQNLAYYFANPTQIFAVWQGGMAFFGAIFGGVGALFFLSRRHHVSFWLLFDAGVLFAVVGQPIGRIGNIINGDILGYPSNLPWATAYSNSNAVLQKGFDLCLPGNCVAYQPAGAYEALATISIGLVLWFLLRRGVQTGVLGMTYLTLYPITQLLVFFARASEPTILFGLKQAQVTSVVVLLAAMVLWVIWSRTHPQTQPKAA